VLVFSYQRCDEASRRGIFQGDRPQRFHGDVSNPVQPPVSPQQGPDAVLKYLARYVAGAAISDHRLISHARGQVTFRVKNYRDGRQRETLTLPGVEFVRRFLLHVLPRGFMRVRYYGLLANTQRATLLPRCRELLGSSLSAEPAENAEPTSDTSHARCPACGVGYLWLIESVPRPTCHSHPSRACLVAPAPRFTAAGVVALDSS
jgi:hypothetical protein